MEESLKRLSITQSVREFIVDVDDLISSVVIERYRRNASWLMEQRFSLGTEDAFSWPSCIVGVSSVIMGDIDSLIKSGIKVVYGYVTIDNKPETRTHHVYFISPEGVIVDWLAGQFTSRMGQRGKTVKSSFIDNRILCATAEEARKLGIYYDGLSYAPREILSIDRAQAVIYPGCLALNETISYSQS